MSEVLIYKPCLLTSANNFTPFFIVPMAPILLSVYMLIGWVGSTRPVLIKCCSHPKFSGSYSTLNLKNGRTSEQINGYTKINGRYSISNGYTYQMKWIRKDGQRVLLFLVILFNIWTCCFRIIYHSVSTTLKIFKETS